MLSRTLGVAMVALAVASFAGCDNEVECASDGCNEGGSGAANPNGGGGDGGAPPADFDACDGPGQCVLAIPGCCGVCGTPTLEATTPIHESQAGAFFDATCDGEDIGCPACAEEQNPNLFAFCEAGTCQEADLPLTELSACTAPEDCVLRAGTGCCTCGGQGWVAIAADRMNDLTQLVCDPLEACAGCEPEPPDNFGVDCLRGHCIVTVLE